MRPLPPPLAPDAGQGWPWCPAEPAPRSETLPRITIITPNFNYGRFLEATLRSILLQGYPNLELFVLDGGSTDGSQAVIDHYAPWIDFWRSGPDGGQAKSINEGIARATGDWINWINSDDLLLPGALRTLAEIIALKPDASWISGGRLDMTADGRFCAAHTPWRTEVGVLGYGMPDFPQDATFLRREFLRKAGVRLAEDAHNVFDTVLYFDLMQHARPLLTTAIFSAMRWHADNKTRASATLEAERARLLDARMAARPRLVRAAHRLAGTRLFGVVNAGVQAAVRTGAAPGVTAWEAAVFLPREARFTLCRAHEILG